jgi:Transposase DDE domain group 1
MAYATPAHRCFPPIAGHTVRAACQGGALSSDVGVLLLQGIDRQGGLTARLANAIHAQRHPSYSVHLWRDLLAQRGYQMAAGDADGHDANSLRHAPLFQRSVDRLPRDATHNLASVPPCSRLEHHMDRKDVYRIPRAVVDPCLASDPEPPEAIGLARDHRDDPTPGHQECAFSTHPYGTYGSLPWGIFAGLSHA